MVDRIVIDNFLSDFDGFREYCDTLDYSGMVNPVDDVFYPQVTDKIPDNIRSEVIGLVEESLGAKISPNAMFLRMSKEFVDCPHQCHTDDTMGAYSLMVYLNRLEDCIGGTSFVIHNRTGLQRKPINKAQELIWEKECNWEGHWSIREMIDMLPNRALIFDSREMHRAMPIGGFGSDEKSGRLVLTMFFDVQ